MYAGVHYGLNREHHIYFCFNITVRHGHYSSVLNTVLRSVVVE